MATTTLIFGTYEGGTVGLKVNLGVNDALDVEQIMSAPCHIGCVRSVASSGRFAATGGTDEVINVYDIVRNRQLGNIGGSVHTSTVSALAVSQNPDLLISGDEDGQIAVTKIKNFQLLRSFKGHKSNVLDIAVHPSGKLALSVSTDNTLRMWDLTRGTCAAVRNLSVTKRSTRTVAQPTLRYTPEGSRYGLLYSNGRLEICSSSSMDVGEYEGPVSTFSALSEEIFVTGDTKGVITVLSVHNEGSRVVIEEVCKMSGSHSARLRSVVRLNSPRDCEPLYCASVCAQGKIDLCKFVKGEGLTVLKSVDTGMRITGIASSA